MDFSKEHVEQVNSQLDTPVRYPLLNKATVFTTVNDVVKNLFTDKYTAKEKLSVLSELERIRANW